MSPTKLPPKADSSAKSDSKSEAGNVLKPSASYSLTLRVKIKNSPGMLGKLTSVIGDMGGDIGAVDIHGFEKDFIIRDITVSVGDSKHGDDLVKKLSAMPE